MDLSTYRGTESTMLQQWKLLPENRTKLEADEVTTSQRITDLDVPYRTLMDPWNCPSEMLPWLAASWGVDLWYNDWPDALKRSMIANIVPLKRGKGTLAGVEAYLEYVDAFVLKAVTPPATAFYRGAMTDASRLAFLDSLPEIRMYPFATYRIAPPFRSFMNLEGKVSKYFCYKTTGSLYKSFGQTSDGPSLYGKKAELIDPLHPEIPPEPIEYTSFQDPLNPVLIETVFIGFNDNQRSFYGKSFYENDGTHYWRRFFTQTSRATSNIVSVTLDDNALSQFAVFSGDVTTDVRPQREFVIRNAPSRAFTRFAGYARSFYGRYGLLPGFYRATAAPLQIYDFIAIYDASRLTQMRQARSFYGRSRLGIANYNAELNISFPMTRTKYRAANWYGTWFMKAWDRTPLYRMLDAVHISKSQRDRVLINTSNYDYVKLSSKLHLGSFQLGQMISTV